MDYVIQDHRHALAIIERDELLNRRFNEFMGAIRSITDDELMNDYQAKRIQHNERGTNLKSITPSINELLKQKMLAIPGWRAEVDIFNDTTGEISNTEWRLDFACDDALCVEVAFNHGEAIAWNLLKPVLACELNHVQKDVQGQIGIYVCATENLKKTGNIDSASGSFEKVKRYLRPMSNQLTIPMVIIGLKPFETFRISKHTKEIVSNNFTINQELVDRTIEITKKLDNDDLEVVKGRVISVNPPEANSREGYTIVLEISHRNQPEMILERDICFVEELQN